MLERGVECIAISSPGVELDAFGQSEGVDVFPVWMPRRIAPAHDAVAVGKIRTVLRSTCPEIVHSHTPKGGLLGMLAARLAGVPVRIYHVHGLPFVTARGFRRRLLRWTEAVSCRLAHRVLCVSHSVRDVVVAEGLCPVKKIAVIAGGSINGIDAAGRFNPERYGPEVRQRVRQEHGIPAEAPVIGFVGRLVRDKGVVELADAFAAVKRDFHNAHLLIVGPEEERDAVPPDVLDALRTDPRAHLLGMTWDTPPLYAAMDLVVLPTYREGFGVVAIEGNAMRLPVIATRIPGCVDAVQDGVTGTLVPPRDAAALADAMKLYLRDPELRRRHGAAGRERVLRDFRQEVIWQALFQEYCRLLREKGLPVPEAPERQSGEATNGRMAEAT